MTYRTVEGASVLQYAESSSASMNPIKTGHHIQGRQQARKLPNPDTGR
jgi:hypothetical protein